MTIIDSVAEWVEILYQHGVREAVLSPGSRPAPLTIAFARHVGIKNYVIPDERSAAFIALGIAKAEKRPVVLLCTSGSAGLNYAPAIAEAFYSFVPLIVLTADRPPEWIDREDGQTIRQQGMYGRHVLASYQIPDTITSETKRFATRLINEAVWCATANPSGPVHLNVPLREPFYPMADQVITCPEKPHVTKRSASSPAIAEGLNTLKDVKGKVLIVINQYSNLEQHHVEILQRLYALGAVVVAEIGSGVYFEDCIHHQDLFVSPELYIQLMPDFVFSIGHHPLSKNLKLLLRAGDKVKHFALGSGDKDVYGCLYQAIQSEPSYSLKVLLEASVDFDKNYQTYWHSLEKHTDEQLRKTAYSTTQFTEWEASFEVWNSIPVGSIVHLANSMPVRYANFWGNTLERKFRVQVNRGTSGIDGSNSTAVGHALTTAEQHVFLLTGDMAFFYDRNAFWHSHVPKNLKIIVFNNHGGGIFRMLPEARQQPELETYFETKQSLTAAYLCLEFGFTYFEAKNSQSLKQALDAFLQVSNQAALLEIFVDAEQSVNFLTLFKQKLKSHPYYGRLEDH